jgi:hypothetical protein
VTNFGATFDNHPVFGDVRIEDAQLGVNIGGGIYIKVTDNLSPLFNVKHSLTNK